MKAKRRREKKRVVERGQVLPPGARVRRIPLSEARATLSALVNAPEAAPLTAITVRDELSAYLVSPAQLARLVAEAGRRPAPKAPLRGTLRIVGDLDEGSREATAVLSASAARTAEELERG